MSPHFQKEIADWVANIGQRFVVWFSDRRKCNGVSLLYGEPDKPYLSFSHIPIKWQALTLLPCSKFFVFVSYFSTTLTVVSAEFVPMLKYFFYENAYINHTWNEFLNYFVLF